MAIWMLRLQLSAAERAPAVDQQRISGWISARNRSSQELTSRTAPAPQIRARSSSSRVPRCDASCMAGARCYDELSHSAPLARITLHSSAHRPHTQVSQKGPSLSPAWSYPGPTYLRVSPVTPVSTHASSASAHDLFTPHTGDCISHALHTSSQSPRGRNGAPQSADPASSKVRKRRRLG